MFNGGEDVGGGFGPNEGLGGWVVAVDEGAHIDFEPAGQSEHDLLQLLVRQFGETALDLMEPRHLRRGEAGGPVRTPSQPALHVPGLAGDAVVHETWISRSCGTARLSLRTRQLLIAQYQGCVWLAGTNTRYRERPSMFASAAKTR